MIFNIFRVPVMHTNVSDKKFEKHIRKELIKSKKQNELVTLSNAGGIQTKPFTGGNHINKVFEKQITGFISSFKAKIDFKWNIETYWINENKLGDFNKPHEHINPGLHFAAVWYLDAPLDSGRIVFMNQFNGIDFCSMWDYFDDPVAFSYYGIKPNKNDLIIFPSNLVHYVEPSRSKKTRVSVAMNIGLTPL